MEIKEDDDKRRDSGRAKKKKCRTPDGLSRLRRWRESRIARVLVVPGKYDRRKTDLR